MKTTIKNLEEDKEKCVFIDIKLPLNGRDLQEFFKDKRDISERLSEYIFPEVLKEWAYRAIGSERSPDTYSAHIINFGSIVIGKFTWIVNEKENDHYHAYCAKEGDITLSETAIGQE